ncbi:winged helix-turn-helix domain-containing protein [Ancylobacter sp. SL191]|uniref:winged helix-turn-helix domain-containing protein n=1 Tax=Ancylobacter sp. SL191 TaxID=2995166 RepID=UPI00226EC8C6|nr:LysR family transcriptional regulator [Ancylobacter sp. SL191]WAC25565.1 LysR family transcriptional regulator [Ancylobacter sp. SL191]
MARGKVDDVKEPARKPRDGLFIRVYFGDGRHIGPGMIELLETIRTERSILSAARKMGMSYRRAWLLVDEIAGNFREPVVVTHPGRRGHGTDLTPFGERLIALYRGIEASSATATRAAVDELRATLTPPSPEPPSGSQG